MQQEMDRGAAAERVKFRKSLRHPNINYRSGWFFVTSQVAHNKSVFGAIVGRTCVLNDFGRRVWAYWCALPAKYPELEVFESVLMPNHFHALLRIHHRPTNREHHLGFLMSRFKGGSGYIYGQLRRLGEVADLGAHLWQFDYWDDLVTDEREFRNQARYIRDNPANWSHDRYGACTAHSFGDLGLLNARRVAFVASQGFRVAELAPRRVWAREMRAEARISDGDGVGRGLKPAAPISGQAVSNAVIVSTFTSAQEREVLRRALAMGRRVVQVVPQGIPPPESLAPELLAACRAGRALLLSPQAPGASLNKKVATWCNEYVLRNAEEIWAGNLSPNGMLCTLIAGLEQERRQGAG